MYKRQPLTTDVAEFYITNSSSRTIYTFANDTYNTNNYTNSDFSNNENWPIVELTADILPSILESDDFDSIDVFGRNQLTYKGWPLYYFGGDTERGDVNGVSAVWPTINVDTEEAPETIIEELSVQISNNETFGDILTDGEGYSLYFFAKDTKSTSLCNGGCLANWPAFYKEELVLGEGLDATYFGVITREDGSKQNTYKGWPLYYYANDTAAGEVNGDGLGGNWFIGKPDYSLMYAQATIANEENKFYMTNAAGRTMYIFRNDNFNTNNYTNSDFSNNDTWPIVEITAEVIPSVLEVEDFGMIEVHGKMQLTYKGWPLYYFGNDVERGDVNGVGPVWLTINMVFQTAPEIIER